MKVWIDAQLPPTLATWLTANFELEALALRDLSLQDAQDIEIFASARNDNAVIITKDSDFIDLGLPAGDAAANSTVNLRKCYQPEFTPIVDSNFTRCARTTASRGNDCRNQ